MPRTEAGGGDRNDDAERNRGSEMDSDFKAEVRRLAEELEGEGLDQLAELLRGGGGGQMNNEKEGDDKEGSGSALEKLARNDAWRWRTGTRKAKTE